MWTVIYVAQTEEESQNIKQKLVSEGFLVKLRQMGKNDDSFVEVLVPESEADEAHFVLDQAY